MALQVEITDSRWTGGCLTHTEYGVKVSDGNRNWTVEKRYSDFVALDGLLREVPGYRRPTLPQKGCLGIRHRLNIGDFNERRQQGLQQYLSDMAGQVTTLADIPCLRDFFYKPGTIETGAPSFRPQPSSARPSAAFNAIDPEEKLGLPMPIFMVPEIDVDEKGDNGIIEIAFAESEEMNGVEVTVIFKDEDRPSHVEDVIYDAIRKPIFGRSEDIETFTFVRGESGGSFEKMHFKGTYSGDQNWSCKVPAHLSEEVDISRFSKEGNRTVIWINVWNHLFGPENTNPDMKIARVDDYPCTSGTRKQVDTRYKGMISSIA